jgi:molecular chaperone GrpE
MTEQLFAQEEQPTPEGEAAAAELSPLEQAQQALQAAEAQAADYLDKYRRSAAEFANYRKRIDREREQQRARITIEVLRKLLPPLDDMDRAVANVPAELVDLPWVAGVALIERKLAALLTHFHVVAMQPVGQPFDPRYHEALAREPSDVYPEDVVASQIQLGYLLGDEVLRPARVSVSAGPGPSGAYAEADS